MSGYIYAQYSLIYRTGITEGINNMWHQGSYRYSVTLAITVDSKAIGSSMWSIILIMHIAIECPKESLIYSLFNCSILCANN